MYDKKQETFGYDPKRRLFLKKAGVVATSSIAALLTNGLEGLSGLIEVENAFAGHLRSGTPDTVILPNGEVVYNLAGLWHGLYHLTIGRREMVDRWEREILIKQKGREIEAFYNNEGAQGLEKGGKSFWGKLKGDGFEELFSYTPRRGPAWSRGTIYSSKSIQIINEYYTITLTKK